jgi:alkaline phosphatase
VPDEGADATALACGARVDNGYVAMNARNEALKSLIYAAEQAQRATGLVTTSSLVRPTPVAFYSTTKGTPDLYRNAEDLIYSDIDVVLGGGAQYFLPASAINELGRSDGRNLLDEAGRRGYTLLRTRDDLNRLSTWRFRQVLGLFAPADFYFAALRPEHSTQPSLTEMTQAAISCLNHNLNGYFLVVAPGLVARASEQNLGKLAADEVVAVDEAIAAAVEYAGPDALVLVTNSYNLGALAQPMPTAGSTAALWLDGPGGIPDTKTDAAWRKGRYDQGWFSTNGLFQPQPALYFAAQAKPLAGSAWLASRGEDSVQFRGFLENTDLFDLISEQF